jgi:hypothetical protein
VPQLGLDNVSDPRQASIRFAGYGGHALEDGGGDLVVRGTPRAQAGSAAQIAAYASKNLLRSLNVTDATFPTRFVVEFVQLMHDCGYHRSYVASPEFEHVLLQQLRIALNPQGRDSSAPYRQIRSELAASEDVAQPIRVACLVGAAGTRLPRCHAS